MAMMATTMMTTRRVMANVLMESAGDRNEKGTIRRKPPLSKSIRPGCGNRGVDATVGKLNFERIA